MSEDQPSIAKFTVHGEPASKANSRRWTGKFFIKSEKALKYSKSFKEQCPVLNPLMLGDLKITVRIYYASRRPDLDPSLIFDLMQDMIYLNDRQLKEQHIYWGLDKENPRSEIVVEVLNSARS
jgi:hypothetical protein